MDSLVPINKNTNHLTVYRCYLQPFSMQDDPTKPDDKFESIMKNNTKYKKVHLTIKNE